MQMCVSAVRLSVHVWYVSAVQFLSFSLEYKHKHKLYSCTLCGLNLRKKFIKHLQFMRINIGTLKWLAIFLHKRLVPREQKKKKRTPNREHIAHSAMHFGVGI